MLSDEERKIETLKKYINSQEQKMNDYYKIDEEFYKDEIEQLEFSIKLLRYILNLIEKKSKEIEELKASHITTNNKATNTEKAKIFDVIDNSIDTYIEKSKPYWEQIMTKDEMTIDEALTIIDDMYQDRYKIMSQKTEKETIVDLGKMDYIKFTNLEWASVRALREVQSLNYKLEKLQDKAKELIFEKQELTSALLDSTPNDKIKAKIEELEKQDREDRMSHNYLVIPVLQSLLEKE